LPSDSTAPTGREPALPDRSAEARLDEPAVLPRSLRLPPWLRHRLERPGRWGCVRYQIRRDDLVERLQSFGGQPRGKVTGDVVEAEGGEDGDPGLGGERAKFLVDQARECLLAGGVQIVSTCGDRLRDRGEAELEERPGAGSDREDAFEGRGERGGVPGIRHGYLVAFPRQLLQRLAPPADEPHRETKPAGVPDDELARVAGGAKDGERAVGHSRSIWFRMWQSRLRSAPTSGPSPLVARITAYGCGIRASQRPPTMLHPESKVPGEQ